MVQIAHISDIHLAPLPPVSLGELFNKRITGYLNWRLNRHGHMRPETLDNLVAHLKSQKPDFTAITGDMVNLALDAEIERAAKWIEDLATSDAACVIPGNHDAYLKGKRKQFCDAVGAYDVGETYDNAPFPFMRRVGDVAIISCNSAVATPPFFASGRVDADQAARLQRMLEAAGSENLYRIVLIHHPPNVEFASDKRRGLRGAQRFRDAVENAGAELVLHGHLHRSVLNEIPGPGGHGVPVVGVAAASGDAQVGQDPARYNLFTIERNGSGGWTCNLKEYGYQRIGEEIVLRLQMRIT